MSAVRAALVALVAAGAALVPQAGHADPYSAGGHRVAVVTVVDQAPGMWAGVAQAVAGWDASRYVELREADHCLPRTYCVTVQTSWQPQAPWVGLTTWTGPTSALVQLNTAVHEDYDLQGAVACHELGHALGIAHPDPAASRPGVSGCIASTDAELTVPTPSRADRRELRSIMRGRGMQGTEPQGWGALWVLGTVGRYRAAGR